MSVQRIKTHKRLHLRLNQEVLEIIPSPILEKLTYQLDKTSDLDDFTLWCGGGGISLSFKQEASLVLKASPCITAM